MSNKTITRRDHTKSFDLITQENHVVHLDKFKGFVLEMEDAHFHHNSAVLLPDYGIDPDPSRITGLAVLAAGLQHPKQNPTHKLLIAGHADTSGTPNVNFPVSEKRSNSVLFALMGEKDSWVGICESQHKVEDYQQILKWANDQLKFNCDPGKIDNVKGPKTTKAVKDFQQQFNAEFGTGLSEDGIVGKETWGAFFDLYMDALKLILKTDDAGLGSLRGNVKFLGKKIVGCGEEFPIEAPRKNNYRSKINRRVELLFFEPGQEPELDCHSGACQPILCEIYNPKMYVYTPVPVPPVPYDLPSYDLQNVRTAVRIAPEKEKVKIEYDITNEGNMIRSGTLKIIRKGDAKVLKSIPLTPDQYTLGPHAIEWDGAVDNDPDFPDSFVTLEHSPYLVEVEINGRLGPKSGQAEIKVELSKFVVELAPRTCLSDAKDKAVWDQIGAIPISGRQEIKLKSNVFRASGENMNKMLAFTAYQTAWGDGPRIPFRATVTVLDSKGAEVRAGKALGRAQVLWDFTDPPQTQTAYLGTAFAPPPATSQSQGAKPYVDGALAYDAAGTRPAAGDNAHMDRGGKRNSASGGPEVLTAPDGNVTNFPFTVTAGATRWWGAFADFQKSGAEEARAGVVFRPSRMGGDNYKLKAYLDVKKSLDTAAATPAGAEKEADIGVFEIWREMTLVKHVKKCPQVTGVMPSITSQFEDAYIRMDNRAPAPTTMSKAQYDVAFANAVAAVPNGTVDQIIVDDGLLPGVSQYDAPVPSVGGSIVGFFKGIVGKGNDPTTWVATFRPWDDFKKAVKKRGNLSNSGLNTVLSNAGITDEVAYAEQAKVYSKMIGEQMALAQATQEGITVLQFEWTCSLEELTSGVLNGRAAAKTRTSCAFGLYQTGAGAVDTPAHEIGHNVFLPHSPRKRPDGTNITAGGGITPDHHDGQNFNCLMSYARPRPGFCGLCLLILRGWKGDQFDQTGPTVVK